MLLNIDIDQLKKEREQLTNRIQQIDWLLSLPNTPNIIAATSPTLATIPTVPAAAVEPHKQRQGCERDVHLVLLTGAATDTEIVAYLKQWEKVQVYEAIRRMEYKRRIFLSETGHIQLTKEGRQVADWFQAHPERKTYTPNGPAGRALALTAQGKSSK